MKYLKTQILVLNRCIYFLFSAGVSGEVHLHRLFYSNMVLQEGRENPIWVWINNPYDSNLRNSQGLQIDSGLIRAIVNNLIIETQ